MTNTLRYNFCYKCAKPLTVDNEGRPICEQHGILWPLHRNAVCGDCIIVNDKNEILLVQRATEPHLGFWGIPGGFTDYGEHPEDAAKREALEETGWSVESVKLLGVYLEDCPGDKSSEHRVSGTYVMHPIEKTGKSDSEVSDQGWFPLDNLPEKIPEAHLIRINDFIALDTKQQK